MKKKNMMMMIMMIKNQFLEWWNDDSPLAHPVVLYDVNNNKVKVFKKGEKRIKNPKGLP